MSNLMLLIRDRYHPLFHLRKFKLFQVLTRKTDIPVGVKFEGIGHKLFISLSKNLSFILAGGFTETQEQIHFAKIVNLGKFKSLFDVGANIGFYGFLFKSLVPDGSVVMVEPDEANLKLLRKTIANFAPEVRLIESAASDSVGSIDFYLDEVSGSTGSINFSNNLFVSNHHNIVPKKVTVMATTLDTLAAQFGQPDFIKIDVEQAELMVLLGAKGMLSSSYPAVFFECDSMDSSILQIFFESGYAIFDFTTLRRTNSLNHNNLALHLEKHANLIALVEL